MKQGWKIMKLGDICEIARGGSPRPIQSYLTDDPNGVNWIKIGDTEVGGKYISFTKERIKREGMRSSRYVEVGDFLLSNSMSFGRPYILKVDGCIHDGWLVIKNYKNTFIQDFLYYLLLSPNVAKQFEEGARGSTVRNLNTNIVSQTSVIVPSLSEQQRIVALLDAEFAKIDALKANAEKNLQNTKDLFQAALKKELEPKEGWKVKRIEEIAEIKGGKRVPKGYKLITEKTPHPYIRVSDFNDNGSVDLGDIHYIEDWVYDEIQRYTISIKDVYVSIAGTIGKSGIIPIELESANLTENACKLVLNQGLNNRYVYYCTINEPFKSQIAKLTMQAAQPKLALTRLATVTIYVPSLEDQQSIVSRLDTLNEKCKALQANYEKTLSLCDDLKQALLTKAFNGEL